MKKTHRIIISIIALLTVFAINIICNNHQSFASSFAVSPMNQKVVLTPGQSYRGSFTIVNPASSNMDFYYKLGVSPFDVNENYDVTLTKKADYSQMINWITIDSDNGSIPPNTTEEVYFTITVPNDAPAGGQYAAITVASDNNASKGGLNVQQTMQIAHLIYAEIAGNTIHDGSILELNVPGFILDGNISGTTALRNDGNTHVDGIYKLQVFPLFSNEEVYTNTEDPYTNVILPDSTRSTTIQWQDTPIVGIFRVIFTVDFDGQTGVVEKLVIKCPIWLLFIIIFAIVALIIWIILRAKNRGNKRRAEA